MKKILILFYFLSHFALFAQTELTSTEAAQFKRKVVEKNKSIKNMQADFQQKKHLDFMSKDIETFGKMAFLKPDKLNWQYTKPYSYQIVFQKDNITINDEGKVSQIKADNKIFKKINALIVNSISGNMFDDKEFTITLWKSNEKTLAKLIAKDKTLQKYIREIHLYFANDAVVESVKLIEPSNDYTEIIFTNKKINTNLDESVFNI